MSRFQSDYCKRGSTKCKGCTKHIPKDELRIGKSVMFKTRYIYQYYHVKCAFSTFEKARCTNNIILSTDEIDGFDLITESDQKLLKEMVNSANAMREKPLNKPKPKSNEPYPREETPRLKKARLISSDIPKIGIMFTNADQLTNSKLTELKKLVERKKPLIIAISEVKPKNMSERTLKDYEIPNFSLYHNDLDSSSGRGIAVYAHNSLVKSIIQVVPDEVFEEACLLEIRLRGGDILLFACLYRSPTPSESSKANDDSLNKLLKRLSMKGYTHVCLVGDFNYKTINWTTWTTSHGEDSAEYRFIEGIRDSYLHQHVSSPTRRRGTDEPSLLDLIFTNESMQVSEVCHIPPLGKSDHDVLTFEFNCYMDFAEPKERYVFEKGDYVKMRELLVQSDWNSEYDALANDPNTKPEGLWDSLKTLLHRLTEECVPRVTSSGKPNWQDKGSIPLDSKTRNSIKDKEKAHRAWIKSFNSDGEEVARLHYSRARNRVKTQLRRAKRRYERNIALEAKKNPKSFWRHARRSLKTKGGVAPLLSNQSDKSSMKYSDEDKANILLKQFSSVFTREDPGEVPTISKRTKAVLKNLHISEEMVTKALKEININKSCGPDMIHPRVLFELADSISSSVTMLFRCTLFHGIVPKEWREALVTPIYKKGSHHHAENYRPISLTSILCKTMERFVRDHLVTHLMDNNLLSKRQFGFINGRSTTLQLLTYLDECLNTIANGGVVDTIYLDFAKAFDTVPHRRLLGKLQAYGIEGNTLHWIKGFLEDRTQEVVVNGTKSDVGKVLSGIPQGTVLGPVLFVVYINDLLDNISSNGLMFADDTKIFRQVASSEDSKRLQQDLDRLEKWSDTWQLHFNTDKCHVLTLGNFENIDHACRYTISNSELEHVDCEKDLGVTIDAEMKFSEHISRKVQVANAIVGQIRRSFSYLDCDTFKRIYVAFVRPHLEYGQVVWSPHLLKYINTIENVQIRATKLVDGFGRLGYVERLKRLKLPTLAFRRKRGDMS